SLYAGGDWQTTTGIYHDTLISAQGCDSIINTALTVTPLPSAAISGNNVSCDNQPVLLSATGGGSYAWSSGSDSSTTSVLPSSPTWYYVTVSNTCGQDVDSFLVDIATGPLADAGNDTTINEGSSAELNGTGGPGWYWYPPEWLSCVICPDPVANPPETTTYYLTVTDSNGCKATDSVTVFVDHNCIHQIPNVFSPNGDGNNDFIHVLGGGFTLEQFIIYDRWGEKLFETTDPSEKWDGKRNGKLLNPGVYVYYLKGICTDGTEFAEQGNITLVK
ncbi:MAG: gliding motility-associated C-terminal domain-containing protein, partial [Flavobacteriales bacterium]